MERARTNPTLHVFHFGVIDGRARVGRQIFGLRRDRNLDGRGAGATPDAGRRGASWFGWLCGAHFGYSASLVRIEDGVASDTFHELLRTECSSERNSNKQSLKR